MTALVLPITVKKGAAAGLPALAPAEWGFTTDTARMYYGTSGGNVRVLIDGDAYTDEQAQDAVGHILLNTLSITWTYDDATPTISAAAVFGVNAGQCCQGNDPRLSDARTPVGTALTSGKIWLGATSNVAGAVTPTGDVTVDPNGVTAIGAGKVTSGMLASSIALAGTPTAPTAGAGTNTTQIASTAFVAAAVTAAVAGLLNFKGATDCSANPNYPAASKGDAYIVSVAGKIGGASGTSVDVGDWYVATAANAGGTEASVGASWGHLEHNLVGALLASNNLSDVANAATAVNNLGGATSTGTGGLVRATSPALVTPALGTPASGVLTNCTGTAAGLTAGAATLAAQATALAAGRTLAMTGDVTWTSPAFDGTANVTAAGTIAADAVTNAKAANMANATIKGRTTAGTGDPEDLTAAQAAALLPAFVAAGGSAAKGLVPAPGATAHPNQPYYPGDDGAWHARTGAVIGSSYVATSETTTGTTAADLATVQSISFTLDESTDVLIYVCSGEQNNTVSTVNRLTIDVDGTDKLIARAFNPAANANFCCAGVYKTTLAAGAHTIKLQFDVNAGTGTFFDRSIVITRA